MSVTIIQPKSAYVNVDVDGDALCKWSSSEGQVAYEILYKRKESTSWSTMGKVASTSKEYDLKSIYNNTANIEIAEIYYKVKIYYDFYKNNEHHTGTDVSQAYEIIFRKSQHGTLKIYDGVRKREYPTFDTINNNLIEKLKINTGSGIRVVPVVSTNHILAGIKVKTNNGVKALSSNYAVFPNYIEAATSDRYASGYYIETTYSKVPFYGTYIEYRHPVEFYMGHETVYNCNISTQTRTYISRFGNIYLLSSNRYAGINNEITYQYVISYMTNVITTPVYHEYNTGHYWYAG